MTGTNERRTAATHCQTGKQAGSRKSAELQFNVSGKGGVSVYGLGRFPVTLYYE
jgi:hypothetical protein